MKRRILARPALDRPRRLRLGLVAVACLVLALTLMVTACGGSSSASATSTTASTTASTAAEATTTTEDLSKLNGTQLGQAIGAAWAEAIQQLNSVLDDQPDTADVQSQVKDLKDQSAAKITAYAKQLKTLDATAQSDAATSQAAALKAAANTEWYTNYLDIYDSYKYASGDADFVNLVGSFNTLTDYAK